MQVVVAGGGGGGCSPSSSAYHHHYISAWCRCSAHPSSCGFPARISRKSMISNRSYTSHQTNCNTAASRDAEAASQNTPGTAVCDGLSMDLHEGGSLQVAIKEASLGDYWEVADTHCAAFLPELVFPMDTIMRLDRVIAMVGGLPLPSGCQRKCLVAVGHVYKGLGPSGLSIRDLLLGWKTFEDDARNELQLESILGILTVDTLAEFLPKRMSTGMRRTGIAYISNVAVRQRARRKGIAKRLVQEAEVIAPHWGCRSIALHCDRNNPGALALYLGAGYKTVKAPIGAKWPQPKAVSGSEFCLMIKHLGSG